MNHKTASALLVFFAISLPVFAEVKTYTNKDVEAQRRDPYFVESKAYVKPFTGTKYVNIVFVEKGLVFVGEKEVYRAQRYNLSNVKAGDLLALKYENDRLLSIRVVRLR